MDDPWDWDVDRVVQELCTPNRSWTPHREPPALPPLDQLEASLREQEVDGYTLITYTDRSDLYKELGIKKLNQKATFDNAIEQFRRHSHKYQHHQTGARGSSEDEDLELPDAPPAKQANGRARNRLLSALGLSDALGGGEKETSLTGATASSVGNHDPPNPPAQARALSPAPQMTVADGPVPELEVEPTPAPASKRRRVAPTTITTDVDVDMLRTIPTAADEISGVTNAAAVHAPVTELLGAYLGVDGLTRIDLVELDSSIPEAHLTAEDKEFNWVGGLHFPPGRRLQVHRLVKRRLVPKRPLVRLVPTKPDTVYGTNDPNRDEILPLYGESDDENGYDSETWEEMEEERDDQLTAGGGRACLDADKVNALIDEEVGRHISVWKESKLPRLSRRAHSVWIQPRKRGTLKMAIDYARRLVADLLDRLDKYRREILDQPYYKEADVRSQCRILEQTIDEKETASWKVGVLCSSEEPQRPPRLPRTAARKRRTAKRVGDDSSEVLTSDSDGDGLGDFIVEDSIPLPSDPVGPRASLEGNASETGSAVVPEDSDHIMDDAQLPNDPETSLPARPHVAQDPTDPVTPSKGQQAQTQMIDLTSTPTKQKTAVPTRINASASRSRSSSSKRHNVSGSSLIMDIADLSGKELAITKQLQTLDSRFLEIIFSIVFEFQPRNIWTLYVVEALRNTAFPKPPYSEEGKDVLAGFRLLQLFDIWLEEDFRSFGHYKRLGAAGKEELVEDRGQRLEDFEMFIDFIDRVSDRFEWTRVKLNKAKRLEQQAATGDLDMTNVSVDEAEALSPRRQKRRRKANVALNREAQNIRQTDLVRRQEQEERRKQLHARLEASGEVIGSQRAMIINESKEENQGFIYVHNEIAPRIKEHQVSGVRFMWNQIVSQGTGPDGRQHIRQGCLLAHTMGLGKTMQIITLLVAIAEAAASPDESISSQVPEDLKESKTLIIPPSGLVNNWMDELLTWTPKDHGLGEFLKISSQTAKPERARIIEGWAIDGGILVMSYNLLGACMKEEPRLEQLLSETPNIVIADEAHQMKNPKSQVHIACHKFRTKSRIALTGSPLANNVEEYHSLINWVAPNFLSNLTEFRNQFAKPIRDGLFVDSSAYERQKALSRLHALKKTVDPKIHRLTISVLKNDIPPKTEFVLFVPLTRVQKKAYEMYIQTQPRIVDDLGAPVTSRIFASLNILRLLCNHPHCFLKFLEQKNADKGKQNAKTSVEEVVDEEARTEGDDESNTNEQPDVTLAADLVSDQIAYLRKTRDIDSLFHSWKMPMLNRILDESKHIGDRVLVFSQSIPTIDYLENVLRMQKRSVQRLDGDTAPHNRQTMVKEFNRKQTDVFLISTTAGGFGLNIAGANRVVIFDFAFNPQQEQQAIGRAYRLGQTKPVFVYRLVCGGTFEDGLLDRTVFKMQLADRVVDKKNPIPKASNINELIKMPTEPEQKDLNGHQGRDDVLDKLLKSEELRPGIRSILLMDTFQEEALDEVTAEAAAEADNLVKDMEQKRNNQGLDQLLSPQQHEPLQPQSSGGVYPQSNTNNTGDYVAPRGGAPIAQAEPIPFTPVLQADTNGQPRQSTLGQHLQPTMGASTSFRNDENLPQHTGQMSSRIPVPNMFPQELRRLFSKQGHLPPGSEDHRQSVVTRRLMFADNIVQAVQSAEDNTEMTEHNNRSTGPSQIKLAVLDAALSHRFICAVEHGMITPQWLVTAGVDTIRRLHQALDIMSQTYFEILLQSKPFPEQFILSVFQSTGTPNIQDNPQVRQKSMFFQHQQSSGPQFSVPEVLRSQSFDQYMLPNAYSSLTPQSFFSAPPTALAPDSYSGNYSPNPYVPPNTIGSTHGMSPTNYPPR